MKKTLLTVLFIMVTALTANADSLVCDPPPVEQQVTSYSAYDNASLIAENITPQADGSLKYDLGEIDSGAHNYTAIACNIRGCSGMSAPFLLPSIAGVPSGLRWIQ